MSRWGYYSVVAEHIIERLERMEDSETILRNLIGADEFERARWRGRQAQHEMVARECRSLGLFDDANAFENEAYAAGQGYLIGCGDDAYERVMMFRGGR